MIEPGSTLRLRKPYTRHLVTVKFEGNKSNAINLEGGRDEAETLALVKEAARKRSYEEHLRSLRKEKEKMGGALLDNPGPMGMNHPTVKKTHHQVEKSNFRSVDKPTRYLFKSLAEMGDGLGAYPASATNSKIVSFMSGEEVEASQGGRRHVDIDLSRFNSDSEDERGTGVSNIPQVDGGNDEESSDGGSMEETDGISDIDASSPLPEEAIHKSSSESDSATDSATDSKDDSVTDSEAAPTDAVNDSIPGWLSESFPEGAFFYRQEPLHQLEATWRATKDGELQECKERRRQALRHSRGSRNGFLGKRKHTK